MCHKRPLHLLVCGLVVLSLVLTGCQGITLRGGAPQTQTEAVELQGASSAVVRLAMGAGRLDVSSGADGPDALMSAEFTYTDSRLQPEVSYEVSAGRGTLAVEQPATSGISLLGTSVRNEWDVRLGQAVPLELEVTLGAGEGHLRLADLPVQRLDLESGAGSSEVVVPAATLTDLRVTMGAGNLTLDLTGDWGSDLAAEVRGGVGEAILRLPPDAGVRVEVSGGLGSVEAPDLSREGDAYVNDAYGVAERTLSIRVTAGVGQVRLELGPATAGGVETAAGPAGGASAS